MKLQLRGKIVLPTVALFILTTALSVWYIQTQTAAALKKSVQESLVNGLETVVTGVDSMVAGVFQDMETLGDSPAAHALLEPGLTPERRQELEAALNAMTRDRTLFKNGFYSYVSILGPDGKTLACAGRGNPGSDIPDAELFRRALAGQQGVAFPLVFDADGKRLEKPAAKDPVKTLVIPFAVSITQDGRTIGVVQAGVYFKPFVDKFIAPVKIGKEGHAFTAAGKGEILYHPASSQVMTEVAPNALTPRMVANKNGMLEYSWSDLDWIAFYKTSPVTNWTMIVKVRADEVFSQVRDIARQAVLINLAQLTVAALVLFLIGTRLSRSLRRTVTFAEQVADGDLERRLDVAGSDEIGALAGALRRMVDNLKEMIAASRTAEREAKALTEKAENAVREAEASRRQAEQARNEGIHEAARRLEALVDSLREHSATLHASIAHMAQGAQAQRAKFDDNALALTRLSDTVQHVAQSAGNASQSTAEAHALAEDGAKAVAVVADSIQEVNRRTAAMKESLSALGARAEDIGQIMGVISDIADQTNLLALNAAIEAARAGDAGRGFAVVADEVRKLAEKTMQATHQVGDSVKAIQEATRGNMRMMDETSRTVDHTTSLATDAGGSLLSIVDAVRASAGHVAGISQASVEQAGINQNITGTLDDLNAITHTTTGLVDEALRNLEEATRTTESLHAMLQDLKK